MDLFFEERLTMTESSNKAACILIVEDEAPFEPSFLLPAPPLAMKSSAQKAR